MAKKLMFVWRGGGAAGSVSAGMAYGLWKRGVIPAHMLGNSAGSLSEFAYGLGGIEVLEEAWMSIKKEGDVFAGNWYVTLPWKSGLKDAGPLRKRLQKIYDKRLPPNEQIPFEVTTVSMRTGEIRYTPHTHPDIVNMTVASASIPGFVECYDAKGMAWCDGGVKENLPLSRALFHKPDVVVCLHTFPLDPRVGDKWEPGTGVDNGLRAITLFGEEIMKSDMAPCTIYEPNPPKIFHLAPEAVIVDTRDFDHKRIKAGWESGEAIGFRAADSILEALR